MTALLDCTLRDGSYSLGFRFTPRQTREISAGLAKAGVTRIEVGHGVGIGASSKVTPALVGDRDYAVSAQEGAPGLWGMFAIPGVSEKHQIQPLVEIGMRFARIGIEANRVKEGIKFVEWLGSKHPQLEIFVNFMKSYSLPPRDFAGLVQPFQDLPIQGVYLVDSAGGMTPTSVQEYANELLDACDFRFFGFHGHNNLGLAVANCLKLQEVGFNLFDATLQGLGRSSGNTPLEQLLALFLKLRVPLEPTIEIGQILRLGESLVRPLIPKAGFGLLDTAAGLYDFHSSHFEALMRVAVMRKVDPLMLLEEFAKSGRQATPKTFEENAAMLPVAPDDIVLGSLDYYSNADSRNS